MLRWPLFFLLVGQSAIALPARACAVARRAESVVNDPLSAAYFRLLEDRAAKVKQRMNESPDADLKTLESQSEWRRFPYAILAPAGPHDKRRPQNAHYGVPKMLALAIGIGELFTD